MGQAKLRGTFEERKAQAIAAGRIPTIRRKLQSQARADRRAAINAHLEFLRQLREKFLQQKKLQKTANIPDACQF